MLTPNFNDPFDELIIFLLQIFILDLSLQSSRGHIQLVSSIMNLFVWSMFIMVLSVIDLGKSLVQS